jgi:hypothetical protein
MISDFAHRLKSGLARGACKLSRDERGNVLLLTAAALLPLIGIIGSGIDIGRSYMAQLRLQQACDAGALAGRRAMAGGRYETEAKAQAAQMFSFNFPDGMYGTRNVRFESLSGAGADVSGTASAILPTSLMYIFGFREFNLSVDCGAKLEIANTDIMMVLDITSSMQGTRMTGLKDASKEFVNEVTGADVGDGRLRIGLVPYSLTVNIGDILLQGNPDWIDDSVTLPSINHTSTKSGNKVTHKYEYLNRKFDLPSLKESGRQASITNFPHNTEPAKSPKWQSTASNTTGSLTAMTLKWGGCVAEADTVAFLNDVPDRNSPPNDLNIDHVPTSDSENDSEKKWKFYLPELVYIRNGQAALTWAPTSLVDPNGYSNAYKLGKTPGNLVGYTYGCPSSKAQKLDIVNVGNKSTFIGKINGLSTHGFTYHDTGMIWGGRLISPDGLFKEENKDSSSPNGKPIHRHILFMTDGDMDTARVDYAHQGLEINMPRVGTVGGTAWNGSRTQNDTKNNDSNARHVKRFEYICDQIKKKDIKIWVVAFGFSANADPDKDENLKSLKNCASEGGMYMASDNAALTKVFVSIAGQISRLRVSQ